jgi:hypothetical protein
VPVLPCTIAHPLPASGRVNRNALGLGYTCELQARPPTSSTDFFFASALACSIGTRATGQQADHASASSPAR